MKTIIKHFLRIADKYRDLRTTDTAPIIYITEQLQALPTIKAADVGCGTGRYDLKLFEHIGDKLYFYCVDSSHTMLEQLRLYLREYMIQNFQTIKANAKNLPLQNTSLDCLLTFNAIHHFKVAQFLQESARVLKDDGYLFIYTRLRSQNSRNIWGRYFPQFSQKEIRLFELEELEALFQRAPTLKIQAIEFFKYERVCSFEQLVERARNHHYSTFCLYTKQEFAAALKQFKHNLREHFDDLHHIRWFDENVLVVARKTMNRNETEPCL